MNQWLVLPSAALIVGSILLLTVGVLGISFSELDDISRREEDPYARTRLYWKCGTVIALKVVLGFTMFFLGLYLWPGSW